MAIEAQHHELPREAMRGDLLEKRIVEHAQPIGFHLLLENLTSCLNLLLDDLLYVFRSGNLWDLG